MTNTSFERKLFLVFLFRFDPFFNFSVISFGCLAWILLKLHACNFVAISVENDDFATSTPQRHYLPPVAMDRMV